MCKISDETGIYFARRCPCSSMRVFPQIRMKRSVNIIIRTLWRRLHSAEILLLLHDTDENLATFKFTRTHPSKNTYDIVSILLLIKCHNNFYTGGAELTALLYH